MKILKGLGLLLVAALLLAAALFPFRRDPVAMLSGKALLGEEVAYPADWEFSDDHMTIAVETQPDDPHSVTTICFRHEGDLYIPAQSGSTKRWTSFVLEDPRVRLKIGNRIYPARAERVNPPDSAPFLSSAGLKYEQLLQQAEDGELPEDLWLFRISRRVE